MKPDTPFVDQVGDVIADCLKIPPERFDTSMALSRFGVDSIIVTEIMKRMSDLLGTSIAPTVFFEARDAKGLADLLQERYGGAAKPSSQSGVAKTPEPTWTQDRGPSHRKRSAKAQAMLQATRGVPLPPQRAAKPGKAAPSTSYEPIAILAMDGLFADSPDLGSLLSHLEAGTDCISEVPTDRWNWRDVYGDPKDGEFTKVKFGGFAPDIDKFDPLYFDLSPREAQMMDPQHRLFIQSAYRALAQCGYAAGSLAGRKVGIFAAVNLQDYAHLIDASGAIEALHLTSLGHMFCPNRLSFMLGVTGPSQVIDTACSSSLIAVHRAALSLQHEGCEMALAGGANLMLTPDMHIMYSKVGMICEDGRCKTFSRDANGYVRGDGVGTVLLKRLSAAERDGDRILAVIRGSAENHGGQSTSLTAPNPNAQAQLIVDAHRLAGGHPERVGFIECHGTGTELGDPIEVNGLKMAFERLHEDASTDVAADRCGLECGIGSIKTNIGHAETAAGIAGLFKAVMSARTGQYFPTLHASDQNPMIDLTGSPFFITHNREPWPRQTAEGAELPRRAGVSSFGAGGSNAHVVIEEYITPQDERRLEDRPELICLSARTEERLAVVIEDLLTHLHGEAGSTERLADLAYTLQCGRDHLTARLAFVARDVPHLVETLTGIVQGAPSDLVVFGTVKTRRRAAVTTLPDADNLQTWAEAWATGEVMDLAPLSRGRDLRRVALPTYPFERRRCWIPNAQATTPEERRSKTNGPVGLALQKTGDDTRFRLTLTGAEACLRDHKVNGQATLPGAAYLEIARAGFEQFDTSIGADPLVLQKVTWVQPLIVADDPQTLEIAFAAKPNGTHGFKILHVSNGNALLCQGSITRAVSQVDQDVVDLEAIRYSMDRTALDHDTVYKEFRAFGLEYGRSHQGIQTLHRSSAGQALARIDLPSDPSFGMSALVPGLIDSALQACLGLVPQDGDTGAALPFALESFSQRAPIPQNCFVWLRRAGESKVDLDILSDAGKPVAQLRGFLSRPLADPSPTDAVLRATPSWHSIETTEKSHPARVLVSGAFDIDALSQALDCPVDPVATGHEASQIYLDTALQVFDAFKTALTTADRAASPLQIIVPATADLEDHLLSGLAGLIASANKESQVFKAQLIEIAPECTAQQIADALQAAAAQPEHHLRLSDDRLHSRRWVTQSTDAVETPWKSNGVYLITGGRGGIARHLAMRIHARAPLAKIVLGVRNADAGVPADLRGIADVQELDVTDPAHVQTAVQDIVRAHGRLNAVFHAAGVLQDQFIAQKQPCDFAQVLAPKVQGTLNLDATTADLDLDAFVTFGSASSIWGSAGQTDYAAANGFLDAFAAHRNSRVAAQARYGASVNVAWPPWRDGGMQLQDHARDMMRRSTGLGVLDTDAALDLLEAAMISAAPQQLVMVGEASRLQEWLNPTRRPSASEPPAPQAKTDPAAQPGRRQDAEEHLMQHVMDRMGFARSDLDPEAEWSDLGFDSITLTEFSNHLNDALKIDITPTVFFEFGTIGALAAWLSQEYPDRFAAHETVEDASPARPTPNTSEADDDPIVIVGMSGRFPKARDLDQFWQNLLNGVDAVSEIPADRWDWREMETGEGIAKWGAFIDGIDQFDARHFGISRREAVQMDPAQRLAMEYVWRALENAGHAPESLAGSATAVILGTAPSGYGDLLAKSGAAIDSYSSTGAVGSVGPNRISYLLDLHGPSEPVETACSSALVALHRGITAIQVGDCEQAIVGGINLILSPETHVSFARAGMLSPDGRSKTFSRNANGYARGEGVGMVFIRKLSAALRDGDTIYALIRGSAENHGGKANSLTAPNPKAQASLVETAIRRAKVDPTSISFIETHGTGTELGDPIEIDGLKSAFDRLSDGPFEAAPYCALGAVKTNIGHLELAAGIAGVLKVLLQMKARTLAPNLHAQEVNPYLRLHGSPFYLIDQAKPWEPARLDDQTLVPRRAGVSSFGFGGVNAHVVMEEYAPPLRAEPSSGPQVFPISARTDAGLRANAQALFDHFSAQETAPLDVDPHVLTRALADVLDVPESEVDLDSLFDDLGVDPILRQHLLRSLEGKLNRDVPARILQRVQSLRDVCDELGLQAGPSPANLPPLCDIAFTLQLGRNAMTHRAAFVASSIEEMLDRLEAIANGTCAGCATGRVVRGEKTDLLTPSRDDLSDVAEAWAKGQPVNWADLHQQNAPRRIPLPGTQFQTERIWFDDAGQNALPPKAEILPMPALTATSGDTSTFALKLTGSEPFLRDHVVAGQQVLPGVVYLQIARSAVHQALGLAHMDAITLRDVMWVAPAQINAAKTLEIRVQTHKEHASFTILDGDAEATIFCKGNASFQSARPAPPQRPAWPELQRADQSADWVTADQIYPIFNQSGLNYGPSHQCLVGLKPDAQRVVAQLRRDDQDTFAAGAIDMEPGLFDAALQASIGFSLSPGSGDAGLMLPFAIEEVSVFAPVPRRVWVTLDRRAADTPVRGVQKLDIDLIDEDGIVVARIKGFSMRTLPMPNLGDHHADTPEAPTEAAYFKALLANSLDCAPDEIDMDEPFEHYGIDSHMVMELTSKLETRFGTLPKTLFFEYETLRDLIDYFEQNHTDAMRNTRASDAKDIKHAIGAQRPARSDHRRTDIAIIGLSGRYPQAYDIAAFWENLKNGRDCITEIPKDRWDWQKYFTEDRSRLDGHYSKWGGFIDDVAAFDPLFFNISPSAAEAMDPQERLFLEHAWMAMEDAGYTRSDFQAQSHGDDGAQIGVYAGVMYGEYQLFGAEQPPGSNTASYYAGIANRVSYAFNLNGPSMAVDTMCSSSLTALHLACADLALGRTDMAFAGGVNLNLHPNKYGLLSMGQYISGSGRCQSFGVDGDGYVPSEGVGVVLLKPLNKAISDGDHIYGVIKSSAVNHGGRTNGYSVPNPKAQQSVISRALQETGLDPRQIGYIEAHGTGTKLGDPIEILGLTRGYGNELQTPCWIGSSKSNIGHGEAVSGLAGLTKVLLQIKSGKIAPSLHAETLNPDIDFDATPFTVNTRLRDWPKPKIDGLDRARAAGISSFGAGGSNAHIIVEEYEAETHHADQTPEPHLLVLSAQSKDQLRQQAQNLFNWLQEPQRSAPLRDIAFTLQIGREAMPYRLGVIVSSAQDLGRELGAYLAERPHQVGEGRAKVVAKPDIADPDAGDLNAVLDGWLRGTVYDFRKLYGSGPQPRRVSLPTYPFARETYWPSFARPPETAARIASEPSHDLLILEPEWTLEPLRDQSRTTVTEHRAVFLGQDPALEGIETVSLATTGEDSATGFEEHALALMADLQACARSKRTGDLVYQLVIDPDKDPSEAAALAGMIDTAAQELRGVFGQTIEVDTAQPGLAELLVKEGARSTVTRIRYVDGQRSVLRWRETCPPLNPTPVWREGGTYLITGGAGGIGKHVARHIATSLSSVKLVLVGRSQSTREHTEFLDELSALGAHAEYHALDLADQGAVETFIKTLVTHQPLHGVLHSAGILSDGLLRSKRPDDLRRVFAPKVAGLANLDRALSGVDLDFFALFSSIAGAMGNPGQADYAAANAYLDAFAQTRKSRHAAKGHTVSIAWPYWADGGMTLDTASTEKMFEASGIAPLSTRSALLALDGILATSLTHALVLEGDGAKMRALIAPDAEASPRARPELTRSEPTVSDPGAPNKSLEREIEAFLTDELASLLRISRDRLEPDVPFVDYGVDSVAIMAFSEKIEKISGPLPATLFFEYPTLETAARELAQSFGPAFATHLGASANAADATPASVAGKPMDAPERPAAAPVHAAPVMMRAENPASDDIAIIGLSGRFPEADTLDVFWDNLIHGRNCITEFPTSRWDHFSSEDQASLTDACKWGGFLSDIDCFDAQFFNITPTEAELLDPQERLFLETCWRVMERAGYLGPNLHDRLNSEVGVFAGSMSQQYHGVQTDPTRAALNLLSSPSSIANRVSYFFDLKGPSVAVDTMCSSSIVAIHMACDALRRGDCRAAIAGAVNVSLHPQKFVGLSAGGFSGTSPDSTSFSDGDGYLPSEAVGAVLLKPLAEAQADHDQILALIKSTAINHSGKSNGYRVPSIAAQIDLYTRNYEKSGIDPKTIGYVEAAANGSALGDSMELAALKRVFGKPASDQDMCALGSVKANIGHAEAASGISQLAKVILQMREACFVPTRINGELNPKLEFADTPFYLPDRVTAWPRPKDHPRRAAIHAIGAGGTNAHLILEDAPERVRPTHAPSGEQCLLPLSARSLAALRQMAGDLANHVAATPDLALEDVAHTLRYGRMDMEVRAAVVCSSMEELSAALSALAEDTTHHALHYASETTSDMRMVFSGETGRHMIATCIDQKDWEKIAQIWIAGARVDWSDLAQDGRCLVPLPGHPLQRLPYWLPETGQHSTQNAADPAGDETDAGGDLEGFFRRYLAKLLRIEMDQVNLNRGALDLGLDSVSILPICQEIEKRTGQSFGIRDTLAYETLAQLIADLDGLLRPQSPSIAEAADPVDRPLPLTQTQQALWLEDQRTPASPAYTVPVALRLKGRLDLEALQAACDEMPKRHQALGSVIRTYEGQPKRFILPDTGVPMKIHDLGHLSEAEATKEMQRLANVGFDLAQGALWRVHLARLGPDHHVLIGLVHHINFDGVSALNLARDLLDVYQAFASQQSPRPSSAAAFGAFVDWQVDMLAGDTGTKLRSHWRDALFDAPPPTRLPSHIAPLVPPDTPRGTVEFTISKADLHDLRRLASDACTTPASVLCTAYMATLARAFDLKDVTLAVPVLGRPSSRFAQSIGYFTNVVPLHCRLAHLETVRSQITHVANTLAIALDNSDLPLPEILAQGKQTAPRLAFAYQNLAPATDGAMPDGLAVSPVTELAQNGGHDLALEIYPQEDGLRCRFDYDACLIDIDAVRGLAEGLCTILRGMCAEATKAFADISFVPDDVEGRLMDEWGNGGPAATGPDLISSIFDHAKATPDATALIERSKQITFSELSDQIRALTGQLQRAGVKPGDHVATCLPKGALCVVSILATWAAGATHVPISMDLPGERQRILADQANVTACLVDRLHLAFDDTVVAQIKVDAAFSGAPGQMVAPDANRLAYVLFTSGTTGTPKGVAVSHTALQHHIHGVAEFYQLSQKDVVLNFADHSFDASIEQWLTPLTRGACVVVKTEALWSAQDACDAIRKNRITLAELPPAFLHEVLLTCAKTQDWDALDTLRAMITGAEAMRPDTIALWQESPLSSRSLFNLYGPTETTIGSTAYCLEPGVTLPSARLPIGRPLPGETAFVVDQYGHPVPVGVPGLLILGGVGLAEGYVNSKAATAQKFVANPVGGTDRLYLTGDIARWTPQGALEFLGRVDTQVSLNGHRVELGEIEKALSGIDGVTHAAVVASQNQEQTEIRAFCEVSKPGMTAASLRQNLQDLLPRYMVPAQVTIIDRLPRTASGKLDTNALRNEPRHAQDGDTPLGGQDDLTRSISDIWADILGVDRVPEHANLADLGMQSLGLIRFAGELYDTLGIRVQVAQLLSAPTVAAQTALITKATESGLICLNEGTDLTPLILIPCGLGSALTYAELMEHLPKNRPIYTMDYPGDADRSLEEVAGTYTKDLLKLGRPVHLVGWSAGGVLAWEIAHQLSEQSDRVAQVSLIDSYAPSVTQRYFADQDNTLAKGNLANFATEMGMTLPHPKTHITLEDIGAATGKDPTALASLFDTYCSMSSIVDAYDPPKATFPVVAFHVNHPNVADALDVWPMADGQTMKQVAVDGNHQTMLQNPNAKALAKAIWSTDV